MMSLEKRRRIFTGEGHQQRVQRATGGTLEIRLRTGSQPEPGMVSRQPDREELTGRWHNRPRFVYWMNVSLDLFIEGTDGEEGASDWLRIDEELHREFNDRARQLSMMVEGRVIYDMMDPFWPDASVDESLPDYIREYGRIWTDKPKVLVSRTRVQAPNNTTVIGGADAVDRLAELRRNADGDIGVGGATLATALLRAHLLDELLLFTHPVVLGAGRPLFDGLDEPLQLDLLEGKSFTSGVAMHRLATRRSAGG